MNKLITYIYILRPINILICLISILICTYLINALSSPILPYAILTVLCFTGASNILNDIFDYNIDKINKPDKVKLYDIIKKNNLILLMSLMYAAGIISTIFINPIGQYIALYIVLPLSYLYTPFFKRMPLIGNIIIGGILGSVFIFTEAAITNNVNKMWIPFYLAGSLSIIRELIKDVEDINGDKASRLKTFPIMFGIKHTLRLLQILTIILCTTAIIPFITGLYKLTYFILLILLVEIPLIWIIFYKLNGNSITNYNFASEFLKYITIGGLIVILSTSF